MMKRITLFLMLILMVLPGMSFAYADDITVGTGVATDGKTSTIQTTDSTVTTTNRTTQTDSYSVGDLDDILGVPNVTTDDIIERINHKGNDVIVIAQTVGRAICIIVFLICCVTSLIGLLGNQRMLTGSIIGLGLSGIMYAAITCGREIVQIISAWAQS